MWWPRPPVSFTSCVKHRTRVSELKQHRNEPYLLATLNIAILWKQGSSHLQHYATYHQGNKCTQRHKWPPKGMFCRSEPLPCSSVLFPSLSLLFTLILLSWIGERFRHLHCFFFKESLCLIHDMKAVRCGWNNFYCPLHHSWRNVMCCFVVVALLKSFSLLSQTFLVVCTFNPVLFCFNRCRPRVQSHKRLVDLFFFFFFWCLVIRIGSFGRWWVQTTLVVSHLFPFCKVGGPQDLETNFRQGYCLGGKTMKCVWTTVHGLGPKSTCFTCLMSVSSPGELWKLFFWHTEVLCFVAARV